MNRYYEVDASERAQADIVITRGKTVRYYRTNVRRQRALWKLTDNLFGSGLRTPAKGQRQNVARERVYA